MEAIIDYLDIVIARSAKNDVPTINRCDIATNCINKRSYNKNRGAPICDKQRLPCLLHPSRLI